MDDIMDELSGTTPDTPQPTQSSSNEFADLSLAFELSRQLERGAASTATSFSNSGSIATTSSTSTSATTSSISVGTSKVGRLEQNSAFKDNTFLRSQQQVRTTMPAPRPNTTSNVSTSSTATNNLSTIAATFSRSQGQTSWIDDRSESTEDSDEELTPHKRHRQKQLSLGGSSSNSQSASRSQGQVQQDQHPSENQSGTSSKVASPRQSVDPKKPTRPNYETVIDRMKDRHRAVIVGNAAAAASAAAAREEYLEEFMDEYGRSHPMPQQMPMGYGVPYALESPMMYTVDDYLLQQQQQLQLQLQQQQQQQQQQQLLYTQALAAQSMAGAIPSIQYAQVNGAMLPNYAYSPPPPAPMSLFNPAAMGTSGGNLVGASLFAQAHAHAQAQALA
ncbi:hypothetical protein BGW38_008423, partial [Lunasporangiospora selenospora]